MRELDFQLGEAADLLRATVREFAAREIAPIAAEIDRTNRFPRELWPRMGALGLLGITVEEADGGAGLGYLEHVVAMEEISRASGSVGLSYGAHSNLCVNQLRRWGSSSQRRRWLPRLLSGEWVGALAMSEPEAGSDVLAMRTRATRLPDGRYRLDGRKMWITNGPQADVVVLYARDAEPAGAAAGTAAVVRAVGRPRVALTAFVVERGTPGFSVGPKLDKLGMRGSDTCELLLQECVVPPDAVLGAPGQGVEILMSGLDYERVVLAGGPLGLMQACIDLVLPYVRERSQFGRPIGEFQLMQAKIADLYTTLNACRAYVYAVAQACDRGSTTRFDAAGCILYASERATQCALQAIQALGGNGYVNDYAAGRLLRDAKLYEIGAGTSEIRRVLIGRELLRDDG